MEGLTEKASIVNGFIDKGFDAVRKLDWKKCADVGGRYSSAFGMIAFQLFGVVGFVASIVCMCRYKGATGTFAGLAFGLLVLGVAAAYIGSKLMTMLDKCIENNKTCVSSPAVMDAIACLLVLAGVSALVVDIRLEQYADGILMLAAALLLAIAAVCPDVVNVEIRKDAKAGQELVGIVSFLAKAILRIAPFAWFAGAAFCSVGLLVCLGSRDLDVRLAETILRILPFALLPVAAYAGFLVVNLVIDLVGSILSIQGKPGDGEGKQA